MAYAANHSQVSTRRPAQLALRREHAFKSARRHSFRVRVLKFLFPLSAVAISALYIVPVVVAYATPKLPIKNGGVVATVGSLIMINPHYTGSHPQYGNYEINADTATQSIKNTDVVTLDKITAEVISPSKEKTMLTAPDGVLRTKEELLTFENGAIITGTNGLWAKLRKAEATFKTRVVTTREPVELRFHNSTVTADGAVIYAAESRVEFIGNVRVHLEREPVAAKAAPSVEGGQTAATAGHGHVEQSAAQLNWAAQTSDEPVENATQPATRKKRARP